MSKKDYVAVARILRQRLVGAESDPEHWLVAQEIEGVAQDLADMFAADNSRFSRSWFMEAVTTGKGI